MKSSISDISPKTLFLSFNSKDQMTECDFSWTFGAFHLSRRSETEARNDVTLAFHYNKSEKNFFELDKSIFTAFKRCRNVSTHSTVCTIDWKINVWINGLTTVDMRSSHIGGEARVCEVPTTFWIGNLSSQFRWNAHQTPNAGRSCFLSKKINGGRPIIWKHSDGPV